ncbi:MAG: hypothetical protein IIW48_13475, partial [Clostridia bacterium]|nr:hypothetical protein [Clostridia bacterium]
TTEPVAIEPEAEEDAPFSMPDFTAPPVPLTTEPVAVEPEAEEDAPFSMPDFTAPPVPLTTEPVAIEPEAEEDVPFSMPDIPSFYKPVALAEDDSDPQDNELIGNQPEANVAIAPPAPMPIEVVDHEETDEEPIKIYTPPTPATFNFGRFNISADVASLFPDVTDETVTQPEEAAQAQEQQTEPVTDSKTRIIDPPASEIAEPEKPADDEQSKTRVIAPPADGKTKHIAFSPVYERPGIVTTSSAYDNTSDLNALPHILPADELIDGDQKKFHRTGEVPKVETQPKPPVVKHYEEGQMVLPGFFELEEVVRVSETEVEEELKRKRSKKVKSFRLEGADIEEPSMDEDVSRELASGSSEGKKHRRFSTTKTRHRLSKQRIEFTRPSDAKKVHTFIARNKRIATISTVITAVCALILLITTGFTAVADSINAACEPVNGAPATYLISLIFLCVSIVAALPACISGVACFFNGSGKSNAQTPVIVAALVALIQNITAITSYESEDYPVFSLAAILLLCCTCAGNILVHSRTMSNFAFLYKQGKEGLHSIRTIDNASDANRVSQNVVMGDADIRYSGRLKFATKFMSYSLSSNSTDDLCAKLVPVSVIISAVIGVIAGFITKSYAGGLSLFSGALCMSAPACAFIAANLPLLIENKKLIKNGAMVTSYAAAFEYESTNAIALDASDLFPSENCNIHGMKTFNGLRVDDAVLTTASMLIAAGGPISGLFENVIMEHNELLLRVEDLKYEERLGLTGWIRDRRIFVGNRKLLENHNIEIPMSIDESKYVRGDRQIIYLADNGKLAAFFVVSYGRNKTIAEYLRHIENNGINILVHTTDSNINEKFIAKCFDLPLNSVKVVSNTAGEVLKKYAEHTVIREDAKLIHNGKAAAFLHAVSAAGKLCSIAGKISTLQTFCMAAGLLLTLLIMIFSGPLSLTPLHVCICQIIWVAIAAILPLFGKE